MRSLILCSVLLSYLVLATAIPVGKLSFLSTTPDLPLEKAKSQIAPENVAGVLSHMMGVSGVHPVPEIPLPAGNFFASPKANLLIVSEGAQLSNNALEGMELSSMNIESFDDSVEEMEESTQSLVSRMMTGKMFGSQIEKATVSDLLCQLNKDSLVLSVATDARMLQAVSLHPELTSETPNLNSISALLTKKFGVSYSGKTSNLKESIQQTFSSKDLTNDILSNEGVPVFDLNVDEDKLFLLEMKALSTLLQVLQNSDVASLLKDDAPDFITFVSSSLKGLSFKYGESSIQYQTAQSVFFSTLKKVQEQFNTMFEQQGLLELLLVNGGEDESVLLNRERRHIVKRDYLNIAAPCYDTKESCENSTSHCSNTTGSVCVYVRPNGNDDCWRCKCGASYAGDNCEFVSLIAPFHTIFWISLALVVALVLICSSLAYMDPGKDTLLFKTAASKAKTE